MITEVLPKDENKVAAVRTSEGCLYATTVHVLQIKGFHLPQENEDGPEENEDKPKKTEDEYGEEPAQRYCEMEVPPNQFHQNARWLNQGWMKNFVQRKSYNISSQYYPLYYNFCSVYQLFFFIQLLFCYIHMHILYHMLN